MNELSDVMGSSHQNVKQILLKLEKKGFVSAIPDEKDKRKQRIFVTDKCRTFLEQNDNNGRHLCLPVAHRQWKCRSVCSGWAVPVSSLLYHDYGMQ